MANFRGLARTLATCTRAQGACWSGVHVWSCYPLLSRPQLPFSRGQGRCLLAALAITGSCYCMGSGCCCLTRPGARVYGTSSCRRAQMAGTVRLGTSYVLWWYGRRGWSRKALNGHTLAPNLQVAVGQTIRQRLKECTAVRLPSTLHAGAPGLVPRNVVGQRTRRPTGTWHRRGDDALPCCRTPFQRDIAQAENSNPLACVALVPRGQHPCCTALHAWCT